MTEPEHASPINGQCLCGAIHFSWAPPSLWCAHCHCSLCRKAHGAGFVTWVGVDVDKLQLDDSGTLTWYASSADSERGFCGTCGSTLFFRSARWPGQMHVARANITSPLDREPSAHVYWENHVDWIDLGDSLERVDSSGN